MLNKGNNKITELRTFKYCILVCIKTKQYIIFKVDITSKQPILNEYCKNVHLHFIPQNQNVSLKLEASC